MKQITLDESPHLLPKLCSQIEESFGYKTPYSYQTDFAPLLSKDNLANCHLYIDENEKPIAHIGALPRKLGPFDCLFLGGIIVVEDQQGQGFFQKLMESVLEKYSNKDFVFLWSDLSELYKKFSFNEVGQIYEYEALSNDKELFQKTLYKDLSTIEQKEIQDLYANSINQNFLSPIRSQKDWSAISEVTSSDLYYLKKSDQIVAYFFKNKGMDLSSIVHEFACHTEGERDLLEELKKHKVWSPLPLRKNPSNILYMGFCRANLTKATEIYIKEMRTPNLRDIWGPCEKPLSTIPLWIPGLDSI